MSILARTPEKNYSPCPEGLHPAVCVDVVDMGLVETTFGPKYKVRFVWQIADIDPISTHRYTAVKVLTNSLHKRASLRALLESWLGVSFKDAAMKAFDLESLLGVNAMLHVTHDVKVEDGSTFAKVNAVMPAPKGTTKLTPINYTRHQDRSGTPSVQSAQTVSAATVTPKPPAEELDTPWPDDAHTPAPIEDEDVVTHDELVAEDVDVAFNYGTNAERQAS